METDFAAFEQKVGFIFKNKTLLRQAFTHRSYLNEHKGAGEHNERLEFLGDAVLELVVSEFLFGKYPTKPEGELTAYRAALVNTTSISQAAQELGMNEFLLLSRGEAKDKGRARQYILANTYEAFIGSLYLDQGYDAAAHFIADTLLAKTEAIVKGELWQDSKSEFQELAQDKFGTTPHYTLISERGPDHDKLFTSAVCVGEREIARGEGKSKQEAEQQAASKALEMRV